MPPPAPTDIAAATFARRLAEARKDRGLSQDEVAAAAGIKAPMLGRYERAEVKPSVEVAGRIATALDLSLDYLIGITDAPLDPATTKRVLDIQSLRQSDREHVYALLDAFTSRRKLEAFL